jgi:hypothetical protein
MKERNRNTAGDSSTSFARASLTPVGMTRYGTPNATRNATPNNAHPALRAPSPSERAGGEALLPLQSRLYENYYV